MIKRRLSLTPETKIYESRLTHMGWAVVHNGEIVSAFPSREEAVESAIALARFAAISGPAEARLFRSDGTVLRSRRFSKAATPRQSR